MLNVEWWEVVLVGEGGGGGWIWEGRATRHRVMLEVVRVVDRSLGASGVGGDGVRYERRGQTWLCLVLWNGGGRSIQVSLLKWPELFHVVPS